MTALAVSAYHDSAAALKQLSADNVQVATISPTVRVKREVALFRLIGFLVAVFMLAMLAVMCFAEARITRTENIDRLSSPGGTSVQDSAQSPGAASY